MNSRAEFEQGGVARVVIAQGLWRIISLWRIHRPTTTKRDGGAVGGEEELEWLPAAQVGGPHQSLHDHHLAQHQLQQRLLTSCNSVGGAPALLASRARSYLVWGISVAPPFQRSGGSSGELQIAIDWSLGRYGGIHGARRREGAREDLEDPNLFFKHPS